MYFKFPISQLVVI